MKHLEVRLAKLEAASGMVLSDVDSTSPSRGIDEFMADWDRQETAWAAEDARRDTRPLEEQLALVRADREAERAMRAKRTPAEALAAKSLDALWDRLNSMFDEEAALEQEIRDRDAAAGS